MILAAGGQGLRCATTDGLPKQFALLEDEPVYIWSLRKFCEHPSIDQLAAVGAANLLDEFKSGIKRYLPDSLQRILFVPGGSTRQESVLAGLEMLAQQIPRTKYVLVHDAVRPFISKDDIDKVISGLTEAVGCTLALPVSDTVKRVENERIVETLDRCNLYLMQTPQGADFDTLLTAHRNLHKKGVATTDDTFVLEQINVPVKIVQGSSLNFKITNADDLRLARALAPVFGKNKKLVGAG